MIASRGGIEGAESELGPRDTADFPVAQPGSESAEGEDPRTTVERHFDAPFYLATYPDVAKSGTDPLAHYLEIGWRELRNPRADFSTAFYLSRNVDVRDAGVEPFLHYLQYGRHEGRAPNELAIADERTTAFVTQIVGAEFDKDYYLRSYPDLDLRGASPAEHYVRAGWREGKNPNADFDTRYYLSANPDVKAEGVNPFFHYLQYGRQEGRLPNPHDLTTAAYQSALAEARSRAPNDDLASQRLILLPEFDTEFYLRVNPELQKAGIDPVVHYLIIGWREHLDPCPGFSTDFYLEENSDIREGGMNPFLHFILYGRAEGRIARAQDDDPAAPRRRGLRSGASRDPEVAIEKGLIEPYFDQEFYLGNDPALARANADPVEHYLRYGWKELRDPSRAFSTAYYLETNADIRAADLNPLVHYVKHGRREGRQALPYSKRLLLKQYTPLVSVIVPNYNHAAFLRQRIDSILGQTYENFELLILDDCSTDDSVAVIRDYESRFPGRIRAIPNERNSGSVFSQWRKGIENTSGDLIWICESDDFCDLTFLEKLVAQFGDPSVMIAFGRIQFADAKGDRQEGLDAYRENAEPGIWGQTQIRPASEWFRHAFGVSNVIANVGGCLLRRQPIPDETWKEAMGFSVVGDWYLYIQLASGGRIAYVPDAVAYFRQHGGNTSVKAFHRKSFYIEQERVLTLLRARWGVPDDIVRRFHARAEETYRWSKAEPHVGPLSELLDVSRVMAVPRRQRHVLMAFLGFHVGGGEFVAIHLANALLKQGYLVSALCLDSADQNESMRKALDARIPVYDAQLVKEMGIPRFLRSAGIDVINSHIINAEFFFFVNNSEPVDIPYLVTLHGSYEVANVSRDALRKFLQGVSHWVWLTEKNLSHLKDTTLPSQALSQIGNGMPFDEAPFPQTREQLGIGPYDLVFTLVSRAIKEKGWEDAIRAFLALQQSVDRTMHLLFCGDGDEAKRLIPLYHEYGNIKFLGFQSRIHGIYRLSDCALLPSRFGGESFPLCLIQAMQVGTPIVATRIGEIERMTSEPDRKAGVLIDSVKDDAQFVASLTEAMAQMLDDGFRKRRAADALVIGRRYSMDCMAREYASVIDGLLRGDVHRTAFSSDG